MITCQRHLFEIPEDVAYLNCAYMAPQLKSVSEAGIRGLRRKATPWRIEAEQFFDDADKARALFARLIGAESTDVAITPSASYGIAIAAGNLNVESGDEIVVLEDQFPSNVYAWHALEEARGARIHVVPRPANHDWTSAVLAALNRRTAVVTIPNVHWTDGTLLDLEAIGARCRETGIALVLDVTQSLGVMPFSIERVQPTFLVAAAYKWLLGPYGLGYLYVHPEYQNGRPIEHNWINRRHSENFSQLVSYERAFQAGAVRYDAGGRSNFITLPMTIAALQQIHEWGIEGIASTLSRYTAQIAREAERLGLTTAGPTHRSPHLIGLSFPAGVPDTLLSALRAAQVYVSVRGASIRISPHVYNNEDDVQRLLDVLATQV